MNDLNNYQLKTDGSVGMNLSDNSFENNDIGISVYFKNLEGKLLSHIEKADAVFGAVAWLTSDPVLTALAALSNVSIIVQKEDFLRPDIESSSNWKNELRSKYSNLRCALMRGSFSNILGEMSYAIDQSIDPVRCVGNHNRDNKPAFPRMHNKFLVFAKILPGDDVEEIKPYAVWTGSFNLTKNATRSLENALYITDPSIVNAYYQEYGQIAAMSELLDWECDWSTPEWRIGS